jgi:serine/threonine protein kinase
MVYKKMIYLLLRSCQYMNITKMDYVNEIKFPSEIQISSISKSIRTTLFGYIYIIKIGTKKNNTIRILKISNNAIKIKNCNENPVIEAIILNKFTNSKHQIGKHNVIKLYNQGNIGMYSWVILEYANMGDAYEFISKKMLYSEKVIMLFVDVLLGYYFMYKNGYCHRDISLENIFVHCDTFLNRVVFKIGDMGVASNSMFFLKDTCGKKPYISPEKYTEISYNGIKFDIWALGIVLFSMLSGHPPFKVAISGNKHYDCFLKYGLKKYISILRLSDFFTNDAIDVLNLMIEPIPEKRVDIITLLQHSYFKDEFEKRGLSNYDW